MLCGALSFAVMSTLVNLLGHDEALKLDFRVIATVRTFLAMMFAAGLALRAGAKFVFFRPGTLWMRSLAGSLALISGFYSLTHLPTTEVLTLTNMFPIWVAILSWPMLGVRPGGDTWGAVLCGCVGIVLLEQPSLGQGNWLWLIALGSSLFSAVALIGLHKLGDIDHRAVVTHFSAVSLLICVATLFLPPRIPASAVMLTWPQGGLLLGVGITATAGQIFLTRAFAAGSPSKVSVVGLSQVGFAMLIEMVIWRRHYHWTTLAGILLVVAPSAWLMLRDRSSHLPSDADASP